MSDGTLSDFSFSEAVEKAIIREANEDYSVWSDSTYHHDMNNIQESPYLTYCILRGDVFSEEELSRLCVPNFKGDIADIRSNFSREDILADFKKKFLRKGERYGALDGDPCCWAIGCS